MISISCVVCKLSNLRTYYSILFNRTTFSNQSNTYQCFSSRIARIPFTTSQLPRTPAELLRARDRTPLIGQSEVGLIVRTKLDSIHWLPSDRACPLVNPPLKHLMYATLIIIVYIYIYNYIYVYI